MVDRRMRRQKAIQKDFFREIRNGMGRFLSILFIVALGTAFFSGIRSTESAMKKTGDVYFDNTNLMDVKIVSTLGLTKEDVQALEELDSVKRAVGSYSMDVLNVITHNTNASIDTNENESTDISVNNGTNESVNGSIDDGINESTNSGVSESTNVLRILTFMEGMNAYSLVQGRLPERADECLIDASYARYGFEVGDTISLQSGTDDELTDTLKNTAYTITGIGNTAQYMSFQRGNTNIGNGEVAGFIVIPPENFIENDIYTEIYIHIHGAREEIAYSTAYEAIIQAGIDEIDTIEEVRREARREAIVAEAKEELDEARKEYNEEKEKVEEELADAFAKLEDARQEIANAKEQISTGERALQDAKVQLGDKQKEVDAGWSSYHAGIGEIEQAKREYQVGNDAYDTELATAMPQIEAGELALSQGRATLQNERNQFEQAKELLTEEQIAEYEAGFLGAEQELSAKEQEVQAGRNALEQGRNQLLDAYNQIVAGENQLATARAQLIDGQRQIDQAWGQIAREEGTLADAKRTLAQGESELFEGEKEYEEGRREAEEEFAKAEQELQDAQQEIEDIEKPKWYVNDREVLSEYTGFGDNAARMQAIGKVFPVIFFMVAALISLTAMTRMVEEQRVQIGTLKALGYSKIAIAMKYISYALLATVLGSVIGVLVGEKLFPFVIISAYTSLYEGLPEIIVPYHVPYALWASAIATSCTLGATAMATYKELSMRPAILMRPPSPKTGKRVFLERITFIWKRLSFTWKATIRNLVRYKKRFMMTVLGIGACMGLMLIGFGLRDSILDVGRLQFQTLLHAEVTLYLQDDLDEEERQNVLDEIAKRDDIDTFMEFYTRTSTVTYGEIEEEAYIVVPKNRENMPEYYTFHDRVSKEEYQLGKDEVILTEKAAKSLGVQAGDSVELQFADYEAQTVSISAITENYLLHYIYVSPELYEELYEESPNYNIVQLNVDASENEEENFRIGESLLEIENVQSALYATTMQGSMDDMLASLNLVLIILTASAGLLAFVVLYNLNTININERRRELATIKVLGFFDKEVSAYVFRENVLLSILGMLAGCLFGKVMHYFVITTVEVELVMFGRNINFPSYLYSMAFTVLFSMLVNAVMYWKLKKINMVESLKSAE